MSPVGEFSKKQAYLEKQLEKRKTAIQAEDNSKNSEVRAARSRSRASTDPHVEARHHRSISGHQSQDFREVETGPEGQGALYQERDPGPD